MKKLRKVARTSSKKPVANSSSNKKSKKSARPRLPRGMKYCIDKVPSHPLHIGNSCNREFGEDIKNYLGEEILELFRKTLFGIFLNMSQCNFQGQISKCLLMLEIQQDNSDEIHVYVQGTIMKFTIFEFALITGLKCTGCRDVPISITHFQIVEDGHYEQFPWGKSSFEKLMTTWRQKDFAEKQLYRLGGVPFILNVWMYECCSEVDKRIVVRQSNIIPRIFNWSVVGVRPRYEKFMTGMFSKFVYNNLRPTHEEVQRLDLPFRECIEIYDPTPLSVPSTLADHKLKRGVDEKQASTHSVPEGFDDFSEKSLPEILIKADFSATSDSKRRKTVMFNKNTIEMQDQEKATPAQSRGKVLGIISKTPDEITKQAPFHFEHGQQRSAVVSPQCEADKTFHASSRMPQANVMLKSDIEEIKSYFQSYVEKRSDVPLGYESNKEEGGANNSRKKDNPRLQNFQSISG
ncbi:hypothetical protein P3S67_018771 [Capsicum chacoense]